MGTDPDNFCKNQHTSKINWWLHKPWKSSVHVVAWCGPVCLKPVLILVRHRKTYRSEICLDMLAFQSQDIIVIVKWLAISSDVNEVNSLKPGDANLRQRIRNQESVIRGNITIHAIYKRIHTVFIVHIDVGCWSLEKRSMFRRDPHQLI